MRICFVFPHPAAGPTGGYKVVYEYANRLAADGFDVDIVYSGSIFWKKKTLRFKLSNIVRYLQKRITGFSSRTWFDLGKKVKEHFTLSMNYRHVPKADVYIATSPYTAWYINEYPIDNSRKFYLIQGREDWGPGIASILEDTYHAKLNKIAVSQWLHKMLKEQFDEESVLIPNGFDLKNFSLTTPINKRNRYKVSLQYNLQPLKRCEDSLKALEIVREKYPDLQVKMYGLPNKPENLPDWIEYFQNPDARLHNDILNSSSIFIASSESEGWGLTVGEAMICGQAVCSTDNAGYREMAIDGETALLSPARNPEALAKNICRLIEDDELRARIAETGNRYIQRFTWDKSYQKLRTIIDNK